MKAAFARRNGPTDRKKLIAGIHAQATALQLDDETRRDMQQQLVGVESTKDMTVSQLSTVWTRLTVLAADAGLARNAGLARRKRPGRDERMPDELVTEEQTKKIGELFDALGIAAEGQARMNFSRRTCGSIWPQTRAQGNKVIEALKAMQARGWRASGAAIAEPPPCSLPAHEPGEAESWRRGAGRVESAVLGQCAQVEAGSTLPTEGEKEEGKEDISGWPSHGDTVYESPITP